MMHVEPGGYERLNEAIEHGTPKDYHYLSSKAEIVGYYKMEHGKGWKQAIVHDLAPITNMKTKNLERRFDPSRLEKVPRTAKAKEEYKTLGKQLPPTIIPKSTAGKRAQVNAVVWVAVSKDKPRKKEIKKTLSASQTSRMKKGDFGPILEAYGINPDEVGSLEVVGNISVQFS